MARFRRCPPLCQEAGLEVAPPHGSSLRLMGIVTHFEQDATVGIEYRVADFWQGLTLDGRLASGEGAKSSNSDSFHRSSWDSVLDVLLCHSQLTTTSSAIHPEIAIQPNQGPTARQRDMTHLLSKSSSAMIPPNNGSPLR